MQVKYIGLQLLNGKKLILHLQSISVNTAMEILSPDTGIFDADSKVKNWKAFFDYAVVGETRFVFNVTQSALVSNETKGEGSMVPSLSRMEPVVLDMETELGLAGWQMLANILYAFILTGEVLVNRVNTFTGTIDEINKKLNGISRKSKKNKE